ncbi:hypothetical protein Q5P01_026142 [Channa striata]|uniref:Dynein heavy chain linker domain-containing protein n=1 Tax=Channa striata TaxID=64152 RepID=A0AA88J220_CHASR|nr:hypothetical protein Q5P01_026142 [Channa striata]
MASASQRPSLPSLSGQGTDNDSRELLHRLPEIQPSTSQPRPPVHVKDPQAVLKQRVIRTQPSLNHLKAREQMFFPGWHTQSPSPQQKQEPHRRHEHLPLHLPPLKPATKKVVPAPSLPRQPFSIKRQLDMPSEVQIYEYSKDEFLMISHEGVVSMCKDELDFTTLERWEEEYDYHCKILRIPFFALFKKWKPFYFWHAWVRAKKITLAKGALIKDLFFVSQSLGPALIDIRKMCYQISETGLCHGLERKQTFTLREFQDTQFNQLQEVLNDLKKFQDLVKEVTVSACHNYLLEPRSKSGNRVEKKIISQISKSFLCSRLTCFIRLVGYLVINTLHTLIVNSVDKLLAVLQEKIRQTPSPETFQKWNQMSVAATDNADDETDKKSVESETPLHVQPMFISELMLDTRALTYKPSEENFQESMAEVIGWFEKTVKSVKTLTSKDFDSVTQAGVLEKEKLEIYEKSPSLEFVIESDGYLQSIIQKIKESLQVAFDAAKVYSHTYEHFRQFYKENESLDLDAMRQEDHDLSFFRQALELYHSEHKDALAITQKSQLGLLLVDKTQLKEKLVSSPLRCLEVINEILTQLARKKLDVIISETCEAQFKLEFTPSTTAEIANSLIFLDEIQERIAVLEEEQETVCQMYNLIKMYSIPTPPEDMVVFATLQPSIHSLHRIIDQAVAERDGSMEKFCTSLQKDIKELDNAVIISKHKLEDPQLLDIEADSAKVDLLLKEIQMSIDALQAQASTYTSYQKKFKVEVTKFDSLEELAAECKLKQLLWDSLDKWDDLQEGWRKTTLPQLELEQLNSQVNKYSKYVNQLEKGLPRNNAVPYLKEKVEVMKQRVG